MSDEGFTEGGAEPQGTTAAPTGGDADPFPLEPASPLAGAKAPAPVRALRATLDRLYAAPELAGRSRMYFASTRPRI